MSLALWLGGILVEDYISTLVVVHARETLHEVADFFPLIVIAFHQISAMLGWYDGGTSFTDFGLGRKCEENPGREGYHWGKWRRALVFVVAKGTVVQHPVHLVEVIDR